MSLASTRTCQTESLDDIRRTLEENEERFLDARAAKSAQTKGRAREEKPDAYRTEFQRDRDRITHTKAFRRLKHKTQVFVSPEFDHYRTRLTHTLEVTQIARTVARALRLNEDLTEAIGLGHDLGHAPFGHVGEEALDRAYRKFDSNARFRHYEHSLRVVDELENGGDGLNLTWEVRDGILHHSKGKADLSSGQTLDTWLAKGKPATLEGQIVRLCDRVAYVNHDIDDAIRAGLIEQSDLPQDLLRVLGTRHAARITTMVDAILSASSTMENGARITSSRIAMRDDVMQATDELKNWMFENIYKREAVDESARVENVVGALFSHFMEHPQQMRGADGKAFLPEEATREMTQPQLARAVCDYVAGMTDRFASQAYALHFMPSSWRGV